MNDAIVQVPEPINEPVLGYAPGSPERARLKAALADVERTVVEVPCVVGGHRVHTGKIREVTMPHKHRHVVLRFHAADEDVAQRAIRSALDARREWSAMRWEQRAAVLLRAAELLAGPWRARMNAATMHGQSKTAHQAEIDSACELIDFWRFNAAFAQELYRMQPRSSPGTWNMSELRPLEGFIFALTPFNFTAIGGNLPMACAVMGNAVVWKPAEAQLLSAWVTYQILEEAGLPPGVVNFIPGLPHDKTNLLLDHPDLAGIHFTGSTDVFRAMWRRCADNLDRYKSYPRLVGETGGKDFILAHPSADPRALATAIVRGGFEYQGQKCSAASRVYCAQSVWTAARDELIATIESLKVGNVADFSNFMGAVIKKGAFDKHTAAIAEARGTRGMAVVAGGKTDDREGWFVHPTLLTTEDPSVRLMQDELFGPVVTLHVYPDAAWDDTLRLVGQDVALRADRRDVRARPRRDPGGGLGAAQRRRQFLHQRQAHRRGGGPAAVRRRARASGTDDKAGSQLNLLRWVAART